MKRFLETNDQQSSSKKTKTENSSSDFVISIQNNRLKTAESIRDFKFNKKRVKILSKVEDVAEKSNGIAYWMARDQRVQDNWALLFSQNLAIKNKIPLHVVFCLTDGFLGATIRHFDFMLKGLEEVANDCTTLNINFHLLRGEHTKEIPKFIKNNKIGAVVCDFSPLRIHRSWVDGIKKELPPYVPLVQVDAHNIVPIWITSDKQEYAARTIRNKINSKLGEFLTEFPPLVKHPHKSTEMPDKIDWKKTLQSLKVDETVGVVDWIKPGYKNAVEVLETFINKRLKVFATKRNDPTINALSNLSPFFHFGQISVQRAIIEVQKHKSKAKDSVDAFCEEAIVRRELSDNFCFHNKNYDNLDGITDWAKITLNAHRKDKRPYLYTRDELEKSKTHDDLWNAAQNQLRVEAKLHGFLRMYWAKKILEWTASPEEALETAIYLNDRYNLDGRDPNGYVGCMWSIGGIHDQGWGERAVFGKIRYMNYEGCKRKFDIKAFIARYGGVVHKKK
ncbi:CLUMA_CG021341, isoform A [Clunio marinus]|uniref:Deoxyribodipyrimidine photo-lyase n=1 Tax=Clunio marinus TaxID=568069 RepID=A0A1J1J7Y8_9DIPT|nr:CLUMA_CG021341, isoform A [Clunio marinus]